MSTANSVLRGTPATAARRAASSVRANSSGVATAPDKASAASTFVFNGETVTVQPGVEPLFQGFSVGGVALKHNLVYSPLTRCRAINTVPVAASATYYSQRASDGGLLISEGTVVSKTGHGYPATPGLYTPEQVAAWKPITAAAKAKGALFFTQLWHVGAASHPDYQPNGAAPISPSGVQITDPAWKVYSPSAGAEIPYPPVRALETAEIPGIIDEWVAAAKNAVAAGFDGVEVHGANGYLLCEFTCDSSNKRTDNYGGSVANRCRLTLDIVRSIAAAIGKDKVGIRLAPLNMFLGVSDSDPAGTYGYMISELNKMGIAYIHLITARQFTESEQAETAVINALAAKFDGTVIIAGGFDAKTGAAAIAAGHADAIGYGRNYLANPDLPKRYAIGAELNPYDRASFYTQDPAAGYTDYPFLGEEKHAGVAAVDPYAKL